MMDIVNPATEERFASIKTDTAESVLRKYRTARAASNEWAQTSLGHRVQIIKTFAQLLQENIEDCAETLTKEMGKPITQARGEILASDDRIRFFIEHVPKYVADEVLVENDTWTEKVSYEPLGVIGNISAWNYPYFVGLNVIIPALLTGNSVLYKPSEFATLSGQRIGALLHKAGVLETAFQVLSGWGNVGAMMLENSLNGVFFTGSSETGKKIATNLGKRLIPFTCELGGKDPAYVCEDADIAATAEALAAGCFYNAGQSCCAVERIYVHTRVWDDFLDAFAEQSKDWQIGDPLSEKTRLGPLSRKVQVGILEAQVRDASNRGADILVKGGATDGPGYFFSPTVLVGTDPSMTIMTEESFGPVIGIQRVDDDAQAVACMNASRYGLTASAHTKSAERAEQILAQVNAATVYWNTCDRVSPYLPWSGRNDSGIGTTLSHLGIRSMLKTKSWHYNRSPR